MSQLTEVHGMQSLDMKFKLHTMFFLYIIYDLCLWPVCGVTELKYSGLFKHAARQVDKMHHYQNSLVSLFSNRWSLCSAVSPSFRLWEEMEKEKADVNNRDSL